MWERLSRSEKQHSNRLWGCQEFPRVDVLFRAHKSIRKNKEEIKKWKKIKPHPEGGGAHGNKCSMDCHENNGGPCGRRFCSRIALLQDVGGWSVPLLWIWASARNSSGTCARLRRDECFPKIPEGVSTRLTSPFGAGAPGTMLFQGGSPAPGPPPRRFSRIFKFSNHPF